MRVPVLTLCFALAASTAGAQTHARHTAAHDAAHAIMLSDADHVALHQLLLGRWTGDLTLPGGARHDLSIRFEEDSAHQQLLVRHHAGIAGFQIRGDTLSWQQPIGSSACVVSTPVSALLQATKSVSTTPARIGGTTVCGTQRSTFTLRKVGS